MLQGDVETSTEICFDLILKGQRLGSSWIKAQFLPNAEMIIETWMETLGEASLGLSHVRTYGSHHFDPSGALETSIIRDNKANKVIFSVKGNQILGENISLTVEQPIHFLLESNLMALSVFQIEMRLSNIDQICQAFLPGALKTVAYNLLYQDKRVQSNLGEIFHIDEEGEIDSVSVFGSDFEFIRKKRKLPRWTLGNIKPYGIYAPPKTIQSEELKLELSDTANTHLATLSMPLEESSMKAIASFYGGTGAYNRHGYTGNFEIGYSYLLDKFAEHEIASIRHERNSSATQDMKNGRGFYDLCEQAEKVHAYIGDDQRFTSIPKIAIGHSLGGLIALELSARCNDLDAIVLLATPGRSFRQITEEQHEWLLASSNMSESSQTERNQLRQSLVDALELEDEWNSGNVDPKILPLQSQRKLYKELLDLDPSELLRSGTCPIVFVQGTADFQVTTEDVEILTQACRETGRPYQLILEEDLDHLLMRNPHQGLVAKQAYKDRRRKIPIFLIRKIVKAIEIFL